MPDRAISRQIVPRRREFFFHNPPFCDPSAGPAVAIFALRKSGSKVGPEEVLDGFFFLIFQVLAVSRLCLCRSRGRMSWVRFDLGTRWNISEHWGTPRNTGEHGATW